VVNEPSGTPREPAGALPSGTVTFLFSDIVGSTQLLREDRESYAAALAEHRRMLRDAFAAHGGREVDTEGDGFFVAFPTAGEAVAAAEAAQRSLAAHPWPDRMRISVRMGLHSGQATVAGDGYVGLAVHRAARIAAAAAGGQVLLSGATAALAGDELPSGTSLHSLGEHRLKDFPEPAALFQVDVAGLPTRFPPLRAGHREPRIPVPAGELLGRDRELAALVSLLTAPRARLVTVTGPGGMGKTRLALEAGRAVADDFSGGVVFVPLSALSDPTLVLVTLADAVGAHREPGVEPLDALRTALGDDRTLVVLDNFEQLVDAAGDVAALLDAVPTAVALVTSRQALRLRSEQRFPLAPLAATWAERLFAERAAAVSPGFILSTGNAAAVTEICRRLDGLPLAIEMAAARIRLLPPAALLERLGQRIDVLAGGPVDLPARQRTLRATMDWSFNLLPSHEQTVFARLAVFSGGWTLSAAERVCARPDEPDVLDALATLLDASLLTESGDSTGEPRLDMLETVKAYAADKLAASPDRSDTERRHVDWVLELSAPLLPARTEELPEALDRLDRERANLRVAVQRTIDSADVETATLLIWKAHTYLTRRDAEQEVQTWLDRLVPLAAEAPAGVRARLTILRALMAGASGDVPAVRALADEGRRLLPDDADDGDHARAALACVFAAMAEGRVEEAARNLDEMAARYVAMGHEVGLETVLVWRAEVALASGDLGGAERHYRAVLESVRSYGDEDALRELLSVLGLVLLARGDVPGARRSILEGAELNRRAGQPAAIAHALEGLAALALADGRAAAAARALGAALAARQSVALPVDAALQPLVDDLVARARDALGPEAYDAAAEKGREWPALEALNRTLDELPGLPESR
jgi:predicted ATPase/class 3 adenylate cyclase